MESKLKILLIEDDEAERNDLIRAIARRGDTFTLTGETGDSAKAITLCAANPPDVVILDLELHLGGGDGLSFLREMNALPLPCTPYVIVTTNNINKITHTAVRNLGAGFIITKNQRGYCADYVLDLALNAKNLLPALKKADSLNAENPIDPHICANELRRVILEELNLLGFNPKNKGYEYLCDAILAAMEDSAASAINYVAEKSKKSKESVARAMQNAINKTWKDGDKEVLYKRYTAKIDKDRGSPTSTEFIHYYAVKLKSEIL